MYSISYKKSVEKELRQLPKSVLAAVVKKIQTLAKNPQPNGSVKLQGSMSLYRVRYSDYRILYTINNEELVILVIKVAHRKEVYRDI
jgi:mRNA interferase RelE/StbE